MQAKDKNTKNNTKESKPEQTEFAVIMTGGKQYKVRVGDIIKIERLTEDYKQGDKVVFDQVLLVDNGLDTTLGAPFINGAKVEGIYQKEGKARKIKVVKYKAKSRYLKKNGHRQIFTEVKISAIK
jgi:large subunit ribosomal protein L21